MMIGYEDDAGHLVQVLLAFLPGVAEDGLGGRDAVGRELHDEGQVVVLDEAAHHLGRDDGHDDAEGVKAEEHERAVAREEGPGHEDVHGQAAGAGHHGDDEHGD